MALVDSINSVKEKLKELKKKARYKKANERREEAAEYSAAMLKCRGQLETCLKEFDWDIREQAKNVRAGIEAHADVAIQEQILWDSAIGYMLVKDAIFALSTVASNNSVAYGYELLDTAVAQMNGKKKKFLTYGLSSSKKARNRYGYITSDAVKDDKVALLEGVFEELKKNGDIEACLRTAQDPLALAQERDRMTGAVDKTSPEYLASLLGGKGAVEADDADIDINNLDD